MARQSSRDREQFFSTAGRHGVRYEDAYRLLRFATILQRLAEAQCNGDWPADNGVRATEVCPLCECGWAPSVIKGGELARGAHKRVGSGDLKACPDCRTTEAVWRFVEENLPEWVPKFGGDPRGAVLALVSKEPGGEGGGRGVVRLVVG